MQNHECTLIGKKFYKFYCCLLANAPVWLAPERWLQGNGEVSKNNVKNDLNATILHKYQGCLKQPSEILPSLLLYNG